MRTVRNAATVAALMLLLSACADPATGPAGSDPAAGADGDVRAEFEERAAQVAAAWPDSAAADTWQSRLVLLEAPTAAPPERVADEVALAWQAGWLRTDLDLPSQPPADGEVRFTNDEVLPVPLISARQAWQEIHTGVPDCPDQDGRTPAPTLAPDPDQAVSDVAPCTVLEVTDVEQGTVTLLTNQGPAQLPAWLFNVAGVSEPLTYVAVSPEQLSDPPRLDGIDFPHARGLATAMALTTVDGAQLHFQLGIGACDQEPTPLVFENQHVVVVAGITEPEPGVTMCTDQLLLADASVTLASDLGQRPVLNTTGEVLSAGRW